MHADVIDLFFIVAHIIVQEPMKSFLIGCYALLHAELVVSKLGSAIHWGTAKGFKDTTRGCCHLEFVGPHRGI